MATSNITNISELTNVIIRDDQNNEYDDSYFYYLAVNVQTGKFIKHYHSSTIASGFTPLNDSVMLEELPVDIQEQVRVIYNTAVRNEALEELKKANYFNVGDTVKVTNPRARKHKNETFIVTGYEHYTNAYGKTKTIYVLGEGVKTNENNCSPVAWRDVTVQSVIDRINAGLKAIG